MRNLRGGIAIQFFLFSLLFVIISDGNHSPEKRDINGEMFLKCFFAGLFLFIISHAFGNCDLGKFFRLFHAYKEEGLRLIIIVCIHSAVFTKHFFRKFLSLFRIGVQFQNLFFNQA